MPNRSPGRMTTNKNLSRATSRSPVGIKNRNNKSPTNKSPRKKSRKSPGKK